MPRRLHRRRRRFAPLLVGAISGVSGGVLLYLLLGGTNIVGSMSIVDPEALERGVIELQDLRLGDGFDPPRSDEPAAWWVLPVCIAFGLVLAAFTGVMFRLRRMRHVRRLG